MKKKALIFGVTGQDGYWLSKLLLEKNYDVYGVARRVSTDNLQRLVEIRDKICIIRGDITDFVSVFNVMRDVDPDEIYNLAAQSQVGESFTQPVYTFQVDALGTLNILECIKQTGIKTKLYQAGSSEQFGKSRGGENGQNEDTIMVPNSPYAIAKLAAYHTVRLYRESYGLFACNGILFNHEGSRRGTEFVTKKITRYVARLSIGLEKCKLNLGNIHSFRDFGHAQDYVRAMWLMLQQKVPDDYVIATGQTIMIKDFLIKCFEYIGITDWEKYVEITPSLIRPAEVDYLKGDAAKARYLLNWKPEFTLDDLIEEMIEYDLNEAEKEKVYQTTAI